MGHKIAIIGGGNLGTAIAEGLIESGFIEPGNIMITKRNTSTLTKLVEKGVVTSSDNNDAVRFADYIILAIKPFQIKDVLNDVKANLDSRKHVLISVATGVWIKRTDNNIEQGMPSRNTASSCFPIKTAYK